MRSESVITTAHFLAAVHDRLLPTGLAELADPRDRPLKIANKAYNLALDNLASTAGVAA